MTNRTSHLLDLTCMVVFPIALVFILQHMSFILIPFLFALLFCYAIGLPMDYLQKRHVPMIIRILLTVLVLAVIFYGLERILQKNLSSLVQSWPQFEEKFWIYANMILSRLEIPEEEARETLKAFFSNLSKEGLKPIGSMVQYLSGSFFSFMGNAVWVILFVIFILSERAALARKIVKGFGPEKAIDILDTMRRINKSVQQYLGLKTLISLLTGVLVAISLSLLQAPFPFLWGLLAFLLNFIPNIGSIVAGIPPILLTLFDSGSITKTLLVTVAFVVIQTVVGNFVEPRVLGKGLDLSPLVVLLSLLFWGWLWGIPGMLLSVPLTAALKISLEQFDNTKPIAIILGDNPKK
ncbi:MAG: AI-2E family transporter [Desulfobulbaceae bacterium]|nr:AI-2E family transporter [Desulfobulbaceae bacterium]